MKTLLWLIMCGLAAATGASAQLIHLTLNGVVTDRFGGETWWSGEGSGVGSPATLHLYYDPDLPATTSDPWLPYRGFTSNSGANNFWRLQFGDIDVSAPFAKIDVTERGLSLNEFSAGQGFTTLDLQLVFATDPSPGFALPVPPFPALAAPDPDLPFGAFPSTFAFDTLSGFGLDEGSLYVGVQGLRAEIVDRFQPVPEPATFAVAGAALLVAVIMARRRAQVRG